MPRVRIHQRFHEAVRFAEGASAQHGLHGKPEHLDFPPLPARRGFREAHMRERRVGEEARGHEPVRGGTVPTGQIVADDAEVVHRRMCELWAAGTFADRPDTCRRGFETVIHL